MKFTLKIFLVVCLFSSIAFADGDMTSGGKSEVHKRLRISRRRYDAAENPAI